MFKLLKYFVPLLFPSLLFAQDSGLYGALDMGVGKSYLIQGLISDNVSTIRHRYIGTLHGKLGYQWQSGWRFGIDMSLAGAGGYKNYSGNDAFVRGMENLPYTFASASGIIFASVGLQLGYPLWQKASDELYLYFTIGQDTNAFTLLPVYVSTNASFLQLDLEGRVAIASKLSLGFGAGVFLSPDSEVEINGHDSDHYMRFIGGNSNDSVSGDLKSGIWGLHGNLKLIYAASKSFDVFIQYEAKARFVPKSETIHTEVYDVLNNRSLGEVSLYTPRYFAFRNGLAFGILF